MQFAGAEIRVLDYIEGQGQVLGYYTNELHHRGYGKATCYLPHDGANTNAVTGLRYADHLRDAEFQVTVKRNMGAGAVAMRIEAVRRIFNSCRFDAKKWGGIEALGFYHEKKDEQRSVGLGPSHDWSSHAADAFGLMALSLRRPGARCELPRADCISESGVCLMPTRDLMDVIGQVMADPKLTEAEAEFLETVPDVFKATEDDFLIASEIVERSFSAGVGLSR